MAISNTGSYREGSADCAPESAKTIKLYDHTSDAVTLDEVERIAI